MHRFWRWVLPCYVWCLPMSMAGLVIAHFVYGASQWAWRDGVLTCIGGTAKDGTTKIWGKPNAQTLGWLQIYDTEASRREDDIRVHECVHIGQAFIASLLGTFVGLVVFALLHWSLLAGFIVGGFAGGLAFAALYGLSFLVALVWQRDGWYRAYMSNPFEVQAYTLQDKYLKSPDPDTWGG